MLALHTGMRIGEVCGLRWCDVDFESGLITVRHSVAYVKDRGSFIKDTKNHDLRTIPVDPVGLLPFLKEIHEIDSQRLREASALGLRDLADSYVVSRPDGSFATTSYIRRAFKTFSETNGLMGTNDELITFHGLRHTFAKQWIRHGGDIKALQSIFGHKDAMVTLTSTPTSSRCPRSRTCCACCRACGELPRPEGGPRPHVPAEIREAIETLEAFGYGISEPDDRNVLIRDVQTISRLYPTEYAAVLGAIRPSDRGRVEAETCAFPNP